jgi:hypothetical protein
VRERRAAWSAVFLLVFCVPLLMGAVCGNDEPQKEEGTSQARTVEAKYALADKDGIDLADLEQAGVPVYPGAALDTSHAEKMNLPGAALLKSSSPRASVTAFYDKELKQKASALKNAQAGSGLTAYTYRTEEGNTVMIELVDFGPTPEEGTTIMVSFIPGDYQEGGSPAGEWKSLNE